MYTFLNMIDSQAQGIIDSYVAAFWKISDNKHEQIAKDFQSFLLIISNDQVYFHLCQCLNKQKKNDQIIEIIHNHLQMSELSLLLIKNISQNGHLFYLAEILEAYTTKWDISYNSLPGILTTAKACEQAILEKLETQLESIHKRKIKLSNVVKPKHIGGAILTINGIMIDFSYDNLIDQMTEQLYKSMH